MSARWPFKDPDETLDYSMDWSRFLGTATISTISWSIKSNLYNTETVIAAGQDLTTASGGATTDSIQNVSQTNTTTVATINIGSGVANREYEFFCTMVDSTGSTAKRSVKIKVRNR